MLSTVVARVIAAVTPYGYCVVGSVHCTPVGRIELMIGRLVTTYWYACDGPFGLRLPSLFWHRVSSAALFSCAVDTMAVDSGLTVTPISGVTRISVVPFTTLPAEPGNAASATMGTSVFPLAVIETVSELENVG